jgi:hypothetical protein
LLLSTDRVSEAGLADQVAVAQPEPMRVAASGGVDVTLSVAVCRPKVAGLKTMSIVQLANADS